MAIRGRKGIKAKVKEVMTSGQACQLFGVCARTFNVWVDRGDIEGYRLPSGGRGKGDRRVSMVSVIKFCEKQKIDWRDGLLRIGASPDDIEKAALKAFPPVS